MGQNGDIVDVMLKTLFEFVGWVFKVIFKLIGWILKGIYNLIASAFSRKEENHSEKTMSENISRDGKLYSFKDAMRDVENAQVENTVKEQLQKRYGQLFIYTATNGNMSVDEKCRVLELLNQKLKLFYSGDVGGYGLFLINSLESSYKLLEIMYGNESSEVTETYDEFKSDLDKRKLPDLITHLMEIFSLAGMLNIEEGEFTVKEETLLKYDLPTFTLVNEDGTMVV